MKTTAARGGQRGLAPPAVGLVPWLALVAGCHVIFDGDLGTVRCEAEGAWGPPACPLGETCVAGVCAAVGAPLGAGCSSDADCRAPGWCLDPASVGEEGAPRCSQPCCTSSDCGPAATGQVCFSPAQTAGAFCWPHHELGRAAPGTAPGGAPCGQGEACRSGLCDKTCNDGCCGDPACDEGTICRLRASDETNADVWSCGQPPGASDARYCQSDLDCRRGRCIPVEGLKQRICAEPCCSSRECDAIDVDGELHHLGCAPGPEGVRACAKLLPDHADGEVGALCERADDCASGICHEGHCSDLCCDDASCGDPSRFACRLGEVEGFSALRCIFK